MISSPLAIQIMIVCDVSLDPSSLIPEKVWRSQAAVDIRSALMAGGLITNVNQSTPRDAAWVKMICATPLPVQRWVPGPAPDYAKILESVDWA